MLKLIVAVLALTLSHSSYAGFGTGLVVGAVVGHTASSSASSGGTTAYTSDVPGRNIIVCCTSQRSNYDKCEDRNVGSGVNRLTPVQFTRRAGYSHLYGRGFLKVSSGCDMLIMEVGNP